MGLGFRLRFLPAIIYAADSSALASFIGTLHYYCAGLDWTVLVVGFTNCIILYSLFICDETKTKA